jgi:hypothetical protein
MIRKYLPVLAMITALLAVYSCRVNYSFTGASISPNVKTITIPYFPNNAPLALPTLSRTFTETLRDYFTSQTNLILVSSGGDLTIEGAITGYSVTPAAIQGNETAGLNRLTITVVVKFTNRTNDKQNFENVTLSRYQDYPSTQDLNSVQDNLIKEINEQLAQDIFNKTVVNW